MKANKIGKILSITSFENPLIKKTNFLSKKKFRDIHNQFFAEGEFFLNEAIKSKWKIHYVLFDIAKETTLKNNRNLQKLLNTGTKITFVTREIIKKITKKDNPQDFLFVVERKKFKLPKKNIKKQLSIILENLRDPGNLGTIFRTMDYYGIKNCFLVDNCVDPYSKEVIRSSMGSLFNIQFLAISKKSLIKWIVNNQINLVGTSLTAKKSHLNYKWELPTAIVFGNEKTGLSDFFNSKCKSSVKIMNRGSSQSLNVSVACGIIIQEISRKFPNY